MQAEGSSGYKSTHVAIGHSRCGFAGAPLVCRVREDGERRGEDSSSAIPFVLYTQYEHISHTHTPMDSIPTRRLRFSLLQPDEVFFCRKRLLDLNEGKEEIYECTVSHRKQSTY